MVVKINLLKLGIDYFDNTLSRAYRHKDYNKIVGLPLKISNLTKLILKYSSILDDERLLASVVNPSSPA